MLGEEGRRKKEEGRRKKEEGRGKFGNGLFNGFNGFRCKGWMLRFDFSPLSSSPPLPLSHSATLPSDSLAGAIDLSPDGRSS
ncbi:hypothetical protein [Tychonema sp. LEGE 06208]|uniref:hypothetical protein n=1 Tax=Tychonema sp. LEGE 06208 TaxID=1828663 RepID=UPI001882E3CD|nr:hypothetical protein [Tychonema sp. LEGE 06208]MBE9164113.1 hypothetical protein [Tychonema sp. LEGE 06208]